MNNTIEQTEEGLVDHAFNEDLQSINFGLEARGIRLNLWDNQSMNLVNQLTTEWRERKFEWEPQNVTDYPTILGALISVEWHTNGRTLQLRSKTTKTSAVERTVSSADFTFTTHAKIGENIQEIAFREFCKRFNIDGTHFKNRELFKIMACGYVEHELVEHPVFTPLKFIHKLQVIKIVISNPFLIYELYRDKHDVNSASFVWFQI